MLKHKNIITIIGKNVRTPPTPPIIPSQINDEIQPPPRIGASQLANEVNAFSIINWKGPLIVNVSWNIKYIIKINMKGAKTLLVTILSILSVVVSFSTAGLSTASAIRPSMKAYLAFAITSSGPSLYTSYKCLLTLSASTMILEPFLEC